jgi:peptide/nickel transport system substrate-binding protein
MKPWTRIAAMLCVLGALAAPAGRAIAEHSHGVPSNILLVANGSEPSTLDPAQDNADGSMMYFHSAYEGLTQYKGSSATVEPLLATSWSISKNGLDYTFHLRPHVQFADGSPFNAAAVKFNVQRVQHINQGYAYLLQHVKKVDVLNNLTVRMTLKQAYNPFLSALAFSYGVGMVSPKGVKDHQVKGDWGMAWFNSHTDGTGPYQLQSWVKNQQAVFTRNPHYWRGWSGNHFEQIIWKVVKEASTQKLMVTQGQADVLLYALSPLEAAGLKGQSGVTVHITPSFDVYYLEINVTKKPLNNVKVRQALAYAMDYKGVIQAGAKGYGKQIHGFTPEGLPPYSASVPMYHLDLTKAKQLLAQAGYPHGGFTIHAIYASGYETHAIYEQILQANMAKLGVHMTVQSVPIPTWSSTGENKKVVELLDTEWPPAVADPSDNLLGLFSCATRGITNWDYYCNPKFDKLVQAGISAKTAAEKAKDYAKANMILYHDVPAIPVYQGAQIIPMSAAVKGFVASPLNLITFNYYDMHK